jgi:hypothetical protein
MSVRGHTLGDVSFDWSSIEVRDVAKMPRRSTRPVKPQIVEATCANCDVGYGPPRARRSAFCSTRCRDQAKYVRYARARRRQYGETLPLDIQYALYVKRVHALGAGYNDSARRISLNRQQQVWERDGGLCVSCGKAADEIDHRDGPSDKLTNLRLLCKPCHHQATGTRVSQIRDVSRLIDSATLRMREEAVVPLRPCDSSGWVTTWREWHRSHVTYAD